MLLSGQLKVGDKYKYIGLRQRRIINARVVVNCVLTLFPMIPCNPRLMLRNATQRNDRAFVHNASPLLSAMLPAPLRQIVSAAAMVNSVCRNVPSMSHSRVLLPILSPILPRKAPNAKQRREVRASLSPLWNVRSRCPLGPSKRRARARANYDNHLG